LLMCPPEWSRYGLAQGLGLLDQRKPSLVE